MSGSFPPDPHPVWLLVVVHLLLALSLVVALCWVIRGSRRLPRTRDAILWGLMVVVDWVLVAAITRAQYSSSPALFLAAGATAIALLNACLIGLRLMSLGQLSDGVGVLGATVLAFGGVTNLLVPGHGHGEGANRSSCRNNLRAIGLALHEVHDKEGGFPPTRVGFPHPRSWRIDLLPWLKNAELRGQYSDDAPWDGPENESLSRQAVRSYQCPSHRDAADEFGRHYTSYLAAAGEGAALHPNQKMSMRDLHDGSSNTLLVIEACGQEVIWTEPRDIDVAVVPLGVNLPGKYPTSSPGLGSSYHRGGCQILMADGAIKFVSEKIDPAILKAVTTASGGEHVEDF